MVCCRAHRVHKGQCVRVEASFTRKDDNRAVGHPSMPAGNGRQWQTSVREDSVCAGDFCLGSPQVRNFEVVASDDGKISNC